MKKLKLNFGHRLKAIRTLKNIEPLVMADRLCVSESTYRRYERNESEPTLSILYKIADIFEISIAELLRDEMEISLPGLNVREDIITKIT
ncbi:helix-turn-helix domain-containing protein [Sphingobacterium griseoflavum]|uniref:HTH cro/C1-type domain-containing protein n=1 Tax=Sphingobacterium griseoflavum TaxID=1474952 RepID=A0ABQ3HXH1_9SPHI|nr:helix-turn-helix transcriptional regulator [Sphingobacterium griseoflavum]GHE34172.1 hypothetical protein GCM10017764_16870 [Sphingobacterium griseoflavum]